MANENKNTTMESVLKRGNYKFKYNFNWRGECLPFKEIILSSEYPVMSKEYSILIEEVVLPRIRSFTKASLEVFIDLVYDDFFELKKDIQSFIDDRDKILSKMDAMILLHLYVNLALGLFIPESEMTKAVGIKITKKKKRGSHETEENEVAVDSKELEKNLGKYMNVVLVQLNDFFESVKRGYICMISNDFSDYINNLLNLYAIVIYSLNKKESDFVSNAKIDSKKRFYSSLVGEDGNFLERKIEGLEDGE